MTRIICHGFTYVIIKRLKLKKEELEHILLCFSLKEENRTEAEKAFEVFYKQYSKYLVVVISNLKSKFHDSYPDIIDITVSNTLLKVFENPPLDFRILDSDTNSDVNNKFKAYLVKKAKWCFFDLLKTKQYIREFELKIDDDEDFFEPIEFSINEKNIKLEENLKVLQELIVSLSEKERNILLTIFEYYDSEKKLPKEILQVLSASHKITKDSIRKVKERGIKKIIKHFQLHKPNLKPIKRESNK